MPPKATPEVLAQLTQAEVNRRVLVIDDQPAILADFRKILTAADISAERGRLESLAEELFATPQGPPTWTVAFEVDTASQGQEGIARARAAYERDAPYSVAFVDIRMPPGIDGIETIRGLWEIDARLQVVICSAYSDHSWSEIRTRLGETDNLLILRKPFDAIEVVQMGHALSRKWTLHEQERQRLASAEARVKKLQALLPVCVHCGKIRDEHNQWTELERYLTLKKAADFTHSVCPGCLDKHYPE